MFLVEFTVKCEKELRKLIKSDDITQDELLVIRDWIQEMTQFGPEYIELCGYWHDHVLRGSRSGERSSSFSYSGRIIYRIEQNRVIVKVLKVTPIHKY